MTTLALYSNKGGVGKTTAAVNLSYLAAQAGAKTLICDLDSQSSATYYFRVKPKLKFGAKGFIKGGDQINKSIKGIKTRTVPGRMMNVRIRSRFIIVNFFITGFVKHRIAANGCLSIVSRLWFVAGST